MYSATDMYIAKLDERAKGIYETLLKARESRAVSSSVEKSLCDAINFLTGSVSFIEGYAELGGACSEELGRLVFDYIDGTTRMQTVPKGALGRIRAAAMAQRVIDDFRNGIKRFCEKHADIPLTLKLSEFFSGVNKNVLDNEAHSALSEQSVARLTALGFENVH